MYLIKPYISIGDLELGMSLNDFGLIFGDVELEKNPFYQNLNIAKYANGITIEYENDKSIFIGVATELRPILGLFEFANRSLEEILVYFGQSAGNIFTDGSVYVSEFLGITTYFEDNQLMEVGIFSEHHKHRIIEGLKTIN